MRRPAEPPPHSRQHPAPPARRGSGGDNPRPGPPVLRGRCWCCVWGCGVACGCAATLLAAPPLPGWQAVTPARQPARPLGSGTAPVARAAVSLAVPPPLEPSVVAAVAEGDAELEGSAAQGECIGRGSAVRRYTATNSTPPATTPSLPRVPYDDEARYKVPSDWFSAINHLSTQYYRITNFCVVKGRLTLYQRGMEGVRKTSFQLYNEFTRHKNPLKYVVTAPPSDSLPGPLVDNAAWALSFWCQDMFHMTLTVMPAFLVKRWADADVYIRLCSGSPCRVKLGSRDSWDDGYNPRWRDKQFKTPGNPMWRMYRVLTDHPSRLRPLYNHPSYNNDTICYREGMVDKKYINLVTFADVQKYTQAQFANFGVRRRPRRCMRGGGYRLTLINRLKKTRRLGNLNEVAAACVCLGFNVSIVQFEDLSIGEQMQVAADTDCLLGVHGNGLIWTLYQEPGAVEIEMAGVWYERYAHLAGNMHFHTTTRDKYGKKYNEWHPLEANMTEVRAALRAAKQHLDSTSCGERSPPPPGRDLASVSAALTARHAAARAAARG
eukprot:TRINITY_DN45100_c0_g1_i1.p1 TRINITY_DN45100_c0_g1~~TRINITY_DN45100_c0_g1_i1.p1  ORF type:complete len:549 (+),score=123.48 TRINITY_DN45100_c0_g1_i1:102-1748(+)